ncbi:MAG: SRPBCC family protein [Actinobacteria bacterium]|nr:SRPBCC family protein [Actinomycetota bacterium]
MRITHSVDIPAPVERVWRVYTNVERWPLWMESMDHVDVMDGRALTLGSQVWIKQPRLPAATWEVTELDPGRSWTWIARSRGVTSTATHQLTAVDDVTTRVDTAIAFSGLTGALLGRMVSSRTREYLTLEAEGLRAACDFDAAS